MTEEKLSRAEEGLRQAMQAVDSQVSREVFRRDPAEKEKEGVQAWAPIDDRIERTSSFVLNMLGENEVQLESLLVFAQAFPKVLQLLIEDLGEEGLGKVRTTYCLEAAKRIAQTAERTAEALKGPVALM
ncbi:MAG: hypothetical protein IT290_07980 [Deltaproteobacteria bacterium]|nr:hypothetical protein [Deltaproteobacteria bacterium]